MTQLVEIATRQTGELARSGPEFLEIKRPAVAIAERSAGRVLPRESSELGGTQRSVSADPIGVPFFVRPSRASRRVNDILRSPT